VQGILGLSNADTTVKVYMQAIEASVKQTQDAIYAELTTRPTIGGEYQENGKFGTLWYGGCFRWPRSA
jgi:hypothetical protein